MYPGIFIMNRNAIKFLFWWRPKVRTDSNGGPTKSFSYIEPRKKNLLLSMKANRDPYIMVYEIIPI